MPDAEAAVTPMRSAMAVVVTLPEPTASRA
jgi:hypothetical protein